VIVDRNNGQKLANAQHFFPKAATVVVRVFNIAANQHCHI